ncbi:MAG: DNA polymerase I [Candidatus Yanofskybacteria bacterium CG10_big_fil_rev_8_21_14_0_10_36_16]|uniref:DNA-directed DNA polymerase n=1 Tax=Candidatus Yanofskybacteria bacterium CG10_big_fil_rev_8_21_14_0_10_36_16 TaxID=1975096 RepID=A0A2J0Q879_9BACT|nr:MAG: DNA polymerase I [Candidatus Yanofskybacteria bacterium CG10_big_fil_rev_8_21_14_0_10_36_16]
MAKKLVLIDGNALVHRAFHALPPLTSPQGVVTNAVFGFSSILMKMIKELKPDYIAATFDLAGPTFRHEEFEDYKAHRVKAPDELYSQMDMVREVLEAFGIPVYEKKGYEADDVIGTVATSLKKEKDLKVYITTGDLDTLQLVDDDKIVVFTLRKGMSDTILYDEKAIMERYGLRPDQMNDYKGLKGDPSDNIPGVPGIGEKTATILIKEYGSLEKLYEYIEKTDVKKLKKPVSVKLAEKLIENKDQAFFSKQLSTIVTDLDVGFSIKDTDWKKNIDGEKVEKIFRDLGFSSLVRRLPEIGLSIGSDFDENTKSSKTKKDYNESLAYYHLGLEDEALKEVRGGAKEILGHGLKTFYKKMIRSGEDFKGKSFDTKIAAYLLNPEFRNYEFEKIYYGEFNEMPTQDYRNNLWRLKGVLENKIDSQKLNKVFEDIEMPLVRVLAEMELNGIKIDTKILSELLAKATKELSILEKKIHKLVGVEFNINSPQQLGEVLFDKLEIKGRVRKTTGGAKSTAAPELEKIRGEHPAIDFILQYRELQKLKSTYIEPFPTLINQETGRLHTTYNQMGTATGRLSSQDPNLQNIPIRTELGRKFRKAFVAEKGFKLVSFDYSQVELRIVAHLAGDEKLIKAFKRGDDIHKITAAEIFGVESEKVNSEMRRQAKVLNFGILYGMGPVGFMRASGVDRARAREFIDRYFEEFSGIAKYIEETKAKAKQDGYVETLFGRRRSMQDIYSTMPQVRAYAERMAVNMPVQGTAADIMKLAMIEVYNYLNKNNLKQDALMLLQVHDELVIEIKDSLIDELSPKIKNVMESVHKFDVPLIVDVEFGSSW